VLLTKGVAVEGTAIIAGELADRLMELGMTAAEVDECRGFVQRIGVLAEAAVARDHEGIVAMHDVTEGGLATALRELSVAGGHGIEIEIDAIPVFPQTARLCTLLGLDPLGLIGSGSLLICCRDDGHRRLLEAIRAARVEVSCIGRVTAPGGGVEAVRQGVGVTWPSFEVDELARLFEGKSSAEQRRAADPA